MRRFRRFTLIAGLIVAGAGLVAGSAAAQDVAGRVIDKDGGDALEAATVILIDTLGKTVGLAHADHLGHFSLHAPEPGWYALYARRLGYRPTLTKWIGVRAGMTVTSDLALEALPLTLRTVEVQAERKALRHRLVYGMDARTIAGDIITPLQIADHLAGARDIAELLQSQHLAWLTFPGGLCAASVRTQHCLTVFVDDVRVSTPAMAPQDTHNAIAWVSPSDVEWMMVIRPADAGVLFGSTDGVLLVYTKGYEQMRSSR